MTNAICILIYTPLLAINALLLCSIILKKAKLRVDIFYALLCVVLIGWLLMEMLFHLLPWPGAVEFLFSAKFVFAAFIPPLFLAIIMGFYRLGGNSPLWLKVSALIVPCITVAVALTSPLHELFRTDVEVMASGPFTRVSSGMGPWYIVNFIYSQALAAAIAFIFFTRQQKLPKAYRTSTNLLILALSVYLMGIVVEMLSLDRDNPLDFNLIGLCLMNLIFYIAVSSNGWADYLNTWQRDIFDHLDEAVLLLNSGGAVVDANLPARKMLKEYFPAMERHTLAKLQANIAHSKNLSLRKTVDERGALLGHDLYVTKGNYPLVYNIERHPLPGSGQMGGEFVTLTDVTRNRLLLERLRETVGEDELTGLKNRFGYEETLRAWDKPENLPLSAIIGDINNLKLINDSLGHATGDALLRSVGNTLLRYCPPGGCAARIGGDEFALLIPRCPAEKAAWLAQALAVAVAQTSGGGKPVSLALGHATKYRPEENINLLIRQADEQMYRDKRAQGVRG